MPEQAGGSADLGVALSAIDRMLAAENPSELLQAVSWTIRQLLPDVQVLAVSEQQADDSALGQAVSSAWAQGTVVNTGAAVGVAGSDGDHTRIAIAVSPPVEDARLPLVAHIAARLLAALPHRSAAHAHELAGSVADQIAALDRAARQQGKCVVLGVVDVCVDTTLSASQVVAERDRLRHRLRKTLRSEDRVYDWGERLLVAQVLPVPHSALLIRRITGAVRSTHADGDGQWRVVDAWVAGRGTGTAPAMDRIHRAERGLARLARLREAGRMIQSGAPPEQAFAGVAEPGTAVVVVNERRLIVGLNQAAMSFFPEAANYQSTIESGSRDPIDTDQLTFHNPDGSVLVDDKLPGLLAMKTGLSGQDRLVGVRFRNYPLHWILLSAVSANDDSGRTTGYVAAMTPADDEDPRVQERLRDAIDLIDDPVVWLLPSLDPNGEIDDFVIQYANSAALAALGRAEDSVIGRRESELHPAGDRLGLVLNYAEVIRTRRSTHRTIVLPDGPVLDSYEISVEPFAGGVLVVAHSLASNSAGEQAASRDSLTGLASRQGLLSRLVELQRGRHDAVTLVMCDIDDFTGVNDSLGRLRSDRYLVEVGRVLSEFASSEAIVARVGSDEFAVLTTAPRTPAEAREFAEELRRRMQAGVTVGERRLTAAASVGVAWTPANAATTDLLTSADMAMYKSKAAGGDCVTVSRGRVMGEGSVEIESQLRHALDNQEFFLQYQPIVDLATGRLRSVEALIRWRHPSGESPSPAKFIPVAERRHLMVDIGLMVLDQVVDQMAAWQQALGRPVRVSMNVSTAQLVRPGLATAIARRTTGSGIDPRYLQLEITESQLLNADEVTLANLGACRDVGCDLAIDDFGTGHAGFDYLRRIPAQILKIDKTFIDGLQVDSTDSAIVSGVVAVGHGLNLLVVAEGVETQEQADALRGLHCDAAQGWLWARAMEPDEVLPFLQSGLVTP